ncbi:sigma-70 family RNA polymerase sigma factor [Kutzneria viridogrisea]|uniref:sigma-70 family RNA polymerase sigma factor n=1 Tax=Kutzneria viridogrisea TaxID=47990 RepID=UPI0016029953
MTADVNLADGPDLTGDEREALLRDYLLLDPENELASPAMYPRLWNVSAGMMFTKIIRAEVPEAPEYVAVPMNDHDAHLSASVAEWNMLWEAAQFRRRIPRDLPDQLYRVADRGDINVVFVPRTTSRYHEYAPLFHLLPRATLERFGLPLLRAGQWPFLSHPARIDDFLPSDFEARLAKAWAATVWRHLMPVSPISGFSANDPIRVLAHNLDFWLPPVTEVVQEVLRELPEVDNGVTPIIPVLEDGSPLCGAVTANPRVGGDVWAGEQEAAELVTWTVEQADADGRLRGILDAIRSHRVQDDFSPRWTKAREDFERKLHRKRAKIQVRFVELTDTIPVHGPETQIVDQLAVSDFLTLLNERDREIVVLLRSGVTKLTEVAEIMGYSNHSAVSKRLARIREQAVRFFDER